MNEYGPLARRRTLSQQIALVLRERIVNGGLRPGDRLPTEHQLCESFQVSRTVIREAVASLKHDGLIDTRQGAGAFVTESSRTTLSIDTSHLDREQTVMATFEARFTLEPVIASLAAERHTQGELKAIRVALDRMHPDRDRDGGAEADAEFHRTLVLASHNPYFIGVVQVMQPTMIEAMTVSVDNTRKVSKGPENTWREHEAIYQAIAKGNGPAAERAARNHLKNSATRLSINRMFGKRLQRMDGTRRPRPRIASVTE